MGCVSCSCLDYAMEYGCDVLNSRAMLAPFDGEVNVFGRWCNHVISHNSDTLATS